LTHTLVTASELTLDPALTHGNSRYACAKRVIDAALTLEVLLPDIRFSHYKSNVVGGESFVDLYRNGVCVGRLDVDRVGYHGDSFRYQIKGKHVVKGMANYYGEGKVWRKNPNDLFKVCIENNYLRADNPQEMYDKERKNLEYHAASEMAEEDWTCSDILRAARDEAINISFGAAPSAALAAMLDKVSEIRTKVMAVISLAELQNAKLAEEFGATYRALDVLSYRSYIKRVLDAQAKLSKQTEV